MLFHVDNVDNFVHNLIFQGFSIFSKVDNFLCTNSPFPHKSTYPHFKKEFVQSANFNIFRHSTLKNIVFTISGKIQTNPTSTHIFPL